jgi:hypothetical protein
VKSKSDRVIASEKHIISGRARHQKTVGEERQKAARRRLRQEK